MGGVGRRTRVSRSDSLCRKTIAQISAFRKPLRRPVRRSPDRRGQGRALGVPGAQVGPLPCGAPRPSPDRNAAARFSAVIDRKPPIHDPSAANSTHRRARKDGRPQRNGGTNGRGAGPSDRGSDRRKAPMKRGTSADGLALCFRGRASRANRLALRDLVSGLAPRVQA